MVQKFKFLYSAGSQQDSIKVFLNPLDFNNHKLSNSAKKQPKWIKKTSKITCADEAPPPLVDRLLLPYEARGAKKMKNKKS